MIRVRKPLSLSFLVCLTACAHKPAPVVTIDTVTEKSGKTISFYEDNPSKTISGISQVAFDNGWIIVTVESEQVYSEYRADVLNIKKVEHYSYRFDDIPAAYLLNPMLWGELSNHDEIRETTTEVDKQHKEATGNIQTRPQNKAYTLVVKGLEQDVVFSTNPKTRTALYNLEHLILQHNQPTVALKVICKECTPDTGNKKASWRKEWSLQIRNPTIHH